MYLVLPVCGSPMVAGPSRNAGVVCWGVTEAENSIDCGGLAQRFSGAAHTGVSQSQFQRDQVSLERRWFYDSLQQEVDSWIRRRP